MWPWYTTGRPPVKFRSIWRPFDAPTVNRVTAKASCVLQPNTPPKQPNNPPKPPPCVPSTDHDRVVENYTPFGHSYLLLAINMCSPPNFSCSPTLASPLFAAGHVRIGPDAPAAVPALTRGGHVARPYWPWAAAGSCPARTGRVRWWSGEGASVRLRDFRRGSHIYR